MKRSMWGAVAVAAFLARSASGQYESPFRGVGIWYNDTGYLVAKAIAHSINTDTLIRNPPRRPNLAGRSTRSRGRTLAS